MESQFCLPLLDLREGLTHFRHVLSKSVEISKDYGGCGVKPQRVLQIIVVK